MNKQLELYNEKIKTFTEVNPYELCNLDKTFTSFILPRLRMFANDPQYKTKSYPPNLEYDEWISILNKMVEAFEVLDSGQLHMVGAEQDVNLYEKVVKTGLLLFAEYFFDLWS